MKPALWLALVRLSALVGLAASAALYVQYMNPVSNAFCSAGSGCEAVMRSGYGYFGSRFVSMPLLGLLGFGALYAATLRPRSASDRWIFRLATAGAVGALGLLVVQAFVVGALCWLCVVADVSALAAFGAAFLEQRSHDGAEPERDWFQPWAAWTLGAVALASPMLWPQVRPQPPVPIEIQGLYQPGKINVVEFADFECPFCRALHPQLKETLAPLGDKVHFVRMNAPLERHEHARPAARAWVCADAQGLGIKMADALVALDLDDKVIRRAAVAVGVDGQRFDDCVASPDTDARIDREMDMLRSVGVVLPTTFVGDKRFVGVMSDAELRDALDRAERGATESGVPAPIYVAIVAGIVLLTIARGRRRISAHA